MYHVDNSTGVPVMPQPSPVTSETELFFTEGGNGVPPTFPGPDWFNIIQSELINILRAAGLDPDKMDNTQILAALKKLFLSRSNPFVDIKADGAAAIATALSNLGLDRINQIPTETIIKLGPDGNKQLFINNGAWGAWDVDLNQAIPLSVAQGGIGSTTASGGRANLELGDSSTRNVGTANGTVMAGDDSRVSALKTAAYKDIGTGAGQVPDMSSFVSNKSVNGRMELPGGVIRQWGVIQVPGNATTEFSFPVPFPSAAYVVVGSFQVPASGSVNMTPLSRTTFNAQNSYATAQYACWIAEGA
ncbi:gp53-like domain-containing protein [Citrobacter freundii]